MEEKEICKEYLTTNIGIEALALKYHMGKKKINEILKRNNIEHKKRGAQHIKKENIVEDWKIQKYPPIIDKHYVVYDFKTDFTTTDLNNSSGIITTYIKKQYGITIPTLYERRKFYMKTGNYWWEQWLNVKTVDNDRIKKCPYCDWTTSDIENKSGAFEQHLLKKHSITKSQYLEEYPTEREYFRLANKRLDLQMETDTNKFVVCKICGSKLSRIDNHHLKTHNITKYDYIRKYGNDKLSSIDYHKRQSEKTKLVNINIKKSFHSNPEKEIMDFMKLNGVTSYSDRKILNGRELDIFIPEKQIAIEFNGNKWHTEFFGNKNRTYHLNKLDECNSKGVNLIQIFEDEFMYNKELVFSKISHILHLDSYKEKIVGRKCTVKEISKDEAKEFLNKNHLQGFAKSSVYLGAFFNEKLCAVMSFKIENNIVKGLWELNRFATDINYRCVGIGGKLFKYFTRNYEYKEIKSFADRRWTINTDDNLYTKLGFEFDSFVSPNYTYYNNSVDRYKRFHKFGFRKNILHKKYNLPLTMTETEMIKELGYDRIWDCGLIKYVFYSL